MGAPERWLRRRYHLSEGEYRDITGDEPEGDTDANPTSGY